MFIASRGEPSEESSISCRSVTISPRALLLGPTRRQPAVGYTEVARDESPRDWLKLASFGRVGRDDSTGPLHGASEPLTESNEQVRSAYACARDFV